jgi:pimeloyl-ACP methyl ester carboxylesterase
MPICAELFYRNYIGDSEGFTFPVILLHGAGGSLMSWPPNLRRLPGQRVFALDLPGHGQSLLPTCNSMRCLVRRLHQFISGMGFYRVWLLGYSLGGALALSYANAYPEQVIGLITASCGDRFHMPQELLGTMRKPSDARKAIEIFSEAAFHSAFPQAERRKMLSPMAKISPDVLQSDLLIASDFNFDSQSDLSVIPTLIIGGADDQITPPASLRRTRRHLKNTRVLIIERAGHMVIYEKNLEVKKHISDFLSKFNKPG